MGEHQQQASERARTPVRPFINDLKIKLSVDSNRVSSSIAGVLERVERSFPDRAADEVELLCQEAIDAVDAVRLVQQEWRDTQPLRDARAAHAAELAAQQEPPAALDLSTAEGMAEHLAAKVTDDGHGLTHLVHLDGIYPLEALEDLHATDHRKNQQTLTHVHLQPPVSDQSEELPRSGGAG